MCAVCIWCVNGYEWLRLCDSKYIKHTHAHGTHRVYQWNCFDRCKRRRSSLWATLRGEWNSSNEHSMRWKSVLAMGFFSPNPLWHSTEMSLKIHLPYFFWLSLFRHEISFTHFASWDDGVSQHSSTPNSPRRMNRLVCMCSHRLEKPTMVLVVWNVKQATGA